MELIESGDAAAREFDQIERLDGKRESAAAAVVVMAAEQDNVAAALGWGDVELDLVAGPQGALAEFQIALDARFAVVVVELLDHGFEIALRAEAIQLDVGTDQVEDAGAIVIGGEFAEDLGESRDVALPAAWVLNSAVGRVISVTGKPRALAK